MNIKRNISRLAAGISSGLLVALAMPLSTYAASSTVVVSPSQMNGWSFANDVTDTPETGVFVAGPQTPPLGSGSAQLTTNTAADGHILGKAGFTGKKLSDLTTLSYSTYQDSTNANTADAIALSFNVDKDVTDTLNTYQGRVVYEPYYNNGGTVPLGSWNQWDAHASDAKFWLSNSATKFDNNCPQSAPCTLSELIALYPNIGVHPVYGALIFKAGSGWTSPFKGNVDAASIGFSGGDTVTYDFEQDPKSPTSKDDCKNNGYKTLVNEDGKAFKNQGDCVSSVASNGKAKGNPSTVESVKNFFNNLF